MRRLFVACVAASAILLGTRARAQTDSPPPQTCGEARAPVSSGGSVQEQTCWIVAGSDGMLFYQSHFYPQSVVPLHFERALEKFNAALLRKGIRLIVVPIPLRGLVHAESLVGTPMEPEVEAAVKSAIASRAAYHGWIVRLRDKGIRAVDVLDAALRQPVGSRGETFFLKTDSHWSPYGAELTARLVAEEIRRDPAYAELQKSSFDTRPTGVKLVSGTIAKLVDRACEDEWPQETRFDFQTTKLESDYDLFGTSAIPVAVVGTSFSYYFNFTGFLRQHAGVDVYNATLPGGGLFGGLDDYFISDGFRESRPSFLVWEIPTWHMRRDARVSSEFRQAVAALDGPCRQPLQTNEAEWLTTSASRKQPILQVTGEAGSASYVTLDFEDKAFTAFTVQLLYEPGGRENVRIQRSDRVRNTGSFFIKLEDARKLKAVELAPFGDPPNGPIRVALCPPATVSAD